MLTLPHNPHCSTSIYAFDALSRAGREFTARKTCWSPSGCRRTNCARSRRAWSAIRPTR
jgi:hypothetical protein